LPHLARNTAIIGCVLVLHGAALWSVNRALKPPLAERIGPIRVLAEWIAPLAPPAPRPQPPMPQMQPQMPAPLPVRPPPPAPAPARQRAKPPRRPTPPPLAAPVATPAPAPVATPAAAPVAVATAPSAPSAPTAPSAPAGLPDASAAADTSGASSAGPSAAAGPAATGPGQLSGSAAYLYSPKPAYPALSRRLGETGRVVVRVLIGPDGHAQEAHIAHSSGFGRLDRLALETARDRWRYVPVPKAMWLDVPFNFMLEDR
jgi:protein TonB